MKRLSVRLFVSHLLVALVGGGVTFLLVRLLAPILFDQSVHRQGQTRGPGQGYGQQLRTVVADAVNNALTVGVLAGVVTAIVLGAIAASFLLKPLREMQSATRAMANGDYQRKVAIPATTELAEVATDFNELADALANTEARRVRLLSEVAHEMRTPLTVIDGNVEGVIDGVFTADPERLELITGEVRRLRRLSDDLSQLSRAEEGRLDLRFEEINLREVLDAATERLRPQFDEAGIKLHTLFTGSITVRADRDRLGQVVTNLLGNALRSVTSRLDEDPARAGEVLVGVARTTKDGEKVARITVTDNGVGIPADELGKIFERFFRGAATRSLEGSGIGLTIARGITRAHGGELAAESAGPGKGATFTLTLPVA